MDWHHAFVVTLVIQGLFLIGLLLQLCTIRSLDLARRRHYGPLVTQFEKTVRLWGLGQAQVQDVVGALRPLGGARAIRALLFASARVRGDAWEDLVRALAAEPWVAATRRMSASRRWWKRRDCARLLSVTATPDDVPEVIRLFWDPHPAVSIAIVPALERVEHADLTAAVIDKVPRMTTVVLAYHAWTLRRSGAALAPSFVDRLLEARGPAAVRLAEFGAHLGDPALGPAFIALAGHTDPAVRARAAAALGVMPEDGVAAVLDRLARDEAWQVRLQAVRALGRIGAPASLETLRAGLHDPVRWVRLRAGGALLRLGEDGRQVLMLAEAGPDAGARDVARLLLTLPPWMLEDVAA